jgi:hypothetical protein
MKEEVRLAKLKFARSHVERCLQDIWELDRVVADPDGDYPFSNGTSACYVRVQGGDPIAIRVFAYAVIGVERSGKLLKELNDLTNRCRMAHVFWSRNIVIVSQVMHIDSVNRKSLRYACNHVSWVADDIGPMIAAVFGGSTPLEADDDTEIDQEAS